MHLIFILVTNDEGLTMAEAGTAPDDDFACYSCSAMETAQQMVHSGDLGQLICSALVLKGGRMLIMHEARIEGQHIYLSILCDKVPNGIQRLIRKIVRCISKALLGNSDTRYAVE